MSSVLTALPAKRRFPWRRFGIDALYVAAFNLICALLITFVFGSGNHFWSNLFISNCIGGIAFAFIDGLRLLLWGADQKPKLALFLLIVTIGVPLGQFAGSHLAGYVLDADLGMLHSAGHSKTNGMLLFTLLATVTVSLIFRNRDRAIRAEAAMALEKARAEAVERQAVQAQLQLLRAQIEPHMLFNTLANLQGLIAIDPQRAQHMLDQLIVFLRATLSSSRSESTTLAQEFGLLDAYLGLMAVRMGERLTYSLSLPEPLREAAVPPMLLQPLVENAIAHAIEPSIGGGRIAISAELHEGRLQLAVCDTGRGPYAGPGKPGTGLGLHNTRERLKALYGDKASVALEAAPDGGTVARILLPS
ncbi:sensor histidine kinase [Massilia endophytica]|uniref:sensor histidine kinase n=1 Tax=Massilia endophytica TaxID=2899220 RepID=UPI001E2A7BDD|nr:histidine kinase [Massilia endophytica]UGQ44865.1 histidine kinase [Massilia endophytica]